ncbi:MAG: sugar phosphate isomerase/epimerase family protein, partial [Candidatus Anammoxibacter sp.]
MQLNTNTSISRNSGLQIPIGNQTSFSVAPTLPFDYAVKNGFGAFEWFPDKKASGIGWDLDDINAEMRFYIKETAYNHNVRLTVHVPWWANPLVSESNEVMFGCFKFADDINATLVNIHLYTENGLEDYVKSILPFIKRSKELNIKLAIENTPLTPPDDFNKLFAILRELNDVDIEYVGMCFDIGHANLCGSTHNDFIGYLDQISLNVPLIHLHLHENYGDYDSHLPLYTGPSRNDDTGIHA